MRIVNQRQFDRLTATWRHQGDIALGGDRTPPSLKIQPTVVVDPDPDEPLMSDEIFGPVLPVVTVQNLDEAIEFVNSRPKPLAAYLFTKTKSVRERVIKEVPAGGMVVNHLVFQFATAKLPFGGVGPSGMGAYHGKWGFEEFSHQKSVLTKPTRPDVDRASSIPRIQKRRRSWRASCSSLSPASINERNISARSAGSRHRRHRSRRRAGARVRLDAREGRRQRRRERPRRRA